MSWVYSAHTLTQPARTLCALRPGPAHNAGSWRELGRVIAPSPTVSWSCRRHASTVSQPALAVSQAVSCPSVTIQKLYLDPSPYCAPCHAPTAPYRGARSNVSQRCRALCRSLSCDTPSSKVALLSRYAHLYHDTIPNGQAMRAHTACPARRPTVLWRMLGRVVAES